ncbi:uncharacterized protein [Malus domestica]|uniref:uncharacterized protein n=1 Tax=Malus domestica TaxID=3750 RepID=UPI003976AAEA
MECRVHRAKQKWRLTGFYGHPITANRHLSWALLKSLGQRSPLPWICMGDFNEILSMEEQLGGNQRRESQMDRFRKAIHACQLIDLGFIGIEYTWTDNRDDEVRCRLDRVLTSQPWLNLFPVTRVCYLNPSKSDHLPILVKIRSVVELPSKKRGRRFRFEDMWLQEESCEETVSSAWSKPAVGLFLFQLYEKIQFTKCALLAWQKEVFGFAKAVIAKVRDKLGVLFEQPPSTTAHKARGELMKRLDLLLGRDETY